MRFTFRHLLSAWLLLAEVVVAGKPRTGYVTFINATPYDWRLTSSHAYQVDCKFPGIVKAGTSHEQYIRFKKDHHDDGAEAYYTLVNSSSPASFAVMARAPKHIEIQLQETLSTLNNPENSVINLGFVENGAVSFVLAGDTNSYISSNPPVAWMQATLSTIGSKSLREIVIPASHDSGMDGVSVSWGGHPHNTQTQTANVFKQLVNGARLFDIRPTYFNKKFYAGHFSRFASGMVGGTGRKISDIVKDINAFTDQYPGELIILDISHQMDAIKHFRDLSPEKWAKFFDEMNKIQALWVPQSANLPDDLSLVPLSTFIRPGSKSAVLIRLPDGAPLPDSGITARSVTKREVVAAALAGSTARMDHTDGMMPLAPALSGDGSDASPATDDSTTGPRPSILPPNQQNEGDDGPSMSDDSSPSDDDSSTPDSDATAATPAKVSSAITIFPFPTTHPAGPAPEPMPAKVPVTPGVSSMAFISESRLPITGSYANTERPKQLAKDQLSKLEEERPDAHAPPHMSIWTITQSNFVHITDVANRKTSITGMATAAHRALFAQLWPALSRVTYPNMIEVDDVRDSQVAALCMAINDYFASPRVRPGYTVGDFAKRRINGTDEEF